MAKIPFIRFHLSMRAKDNGAKFAEPRRGDAGYDLCAAETETLFQNEQKLIETGLTIEIPEGYVGVIKERSSLALKRIYVHAGLIDSSYRGTIGVVLENCSGSNYHIEPGQRIAQLVITPTSVTRVVSVELEALSQTARGTGAFGSTGK